MTNLPEFRIDKILGVHRDIRHMTRPGMVVVMDSASMGPCGFGATEAEARADAVAYAAANPGRIDGLYFSSTGPAYKLILSDWATEYAREHYKMRVTGNGRYAAVLDGVVEETFGTRIEMEAHICQYASNARHWTKVTRYDANHKF